MQNISQPFIAKGQKWSTGNWQLELRGDEFADITFSGISILRSVRAVVRDHDWNTPQLIVDATEVTEAGINLKVHSLGFRSSLQGEIDLSANANSLEISLALVANEDFQSNRTGLVVLHSPADAGKVLDVTHSSGDYQRLKFPEKISPSQPVLDIAKLAWNSMGVNVELQFEGDVFEMEDQRNWSDASYKTYSRPLSEPFPYLIGKEEVVRQKLIINASVLTKPDNPQTEKSIRLEEMGMFPKMQTQASTSPDVNKGSGIPENYNPATKTILVELDLETPNWRAALRRAATNNSELDVRVILKDYAKLHTLIVELEKLQFIGILRIGAFDSDSHVTPAKLSKLLKFSLNNSSSAILRAAKVIVGARSHFTELNREHTRILTEESKPIIDEVTFATTPLFHSTDLAQLIESVSMQRLIVTQALELADGKPVHVGPITLRPRFNNVATSKSAGPELPDLSKGYGAEYFGSYDIRQECRELAAWMVASTASLARNGVASLTWFEQWGSRGLADANGNDYPTGDAFRALVALEGMPMYSGNSVDGKIWAIAAHDGAKGKLLVSNLYDSQQEVQVEVVGKKLNLLIDAYGWSEINLD